MTSAWVVLPTYDERGEPPDRRRPHASRARELRAARRRHGARRRRRVPGRDRRARRRARPRARRRPRAPPAAQGRPRRRLPRGLRPRARRRRRPDRRDGRRPLPRPGRPPAPDRAARHGADVVLGSRYLDGGGVEGWSLHRRLLSRAGGRYAAAVLGLPFSDLTGGFKCFRAGALRALDGDLVHSRGYAFQIELTFHAARAGLRDRGDPDRVPRARARGVEDVAGDRARGDVARPAHAHSVYGAAGGVVARTAGCRRGSAAA